MTSAKTTEVPLERISDLPGMDGGDRWIGARHLDRVER